LVNGLRASGEAGGSLARAGTLGLSARGLLVVAQVALSVVLLIGVALLLESFAHLTGVDPGFRPANLLTMQIALPVSRYDWRKQTAFFEELIQRVQGLPGVNTAAVARTLPMTARIATPVAVLEMPAVDLKDRPNAQMQTISPGYFQTLGIALRRGRPFDDRDRPGSGIAPLIVNESFARLFWPAYPRGRDPIGQHILIGNQTRGGCEIVGIVTDVHERGLDIDAMAELYLPLADNAVSAAGLVVHTRGDPHSLVNSIRAQVLAMDRDQAISNVKTMDEMIASSIGQRRLTLVLLGSFALAALLLASIGIYGVVSYSVAQRTKEMGIRRALGAQQGDILRLVLGGAMAVSIGGVTVGLAGALALTRIMKSLLFHVSASDPATFLAIGLVFVAVALAAGYLPARRASNIDPMAALR
jgi:putative ABC transport system permease protein